MQLFLNYYLCWRESDHYRNKFQVVNFVRTTAEFCFVVLDREKIKIPTMH